MVFVLVAAVLVVTHPLSINPAVQVTIITAISSVIAVGAGVVTNRSSHKAQEAVAATTTRGDIEKEAFDRAKSYYTDTIDRLTHDNEQLETEVSDLKKRVGTCETNEQTLSRELEHYKLAGRRVVRALTDRAAGTRLDPRVQEAIVAFIDDTRPATDTS